MGGEAPAGPQAQVRGWAVSGAPWEQGWEACHGNAPWTRGPSSLRGVLGPPGCCLFLLPPSNQGPQIPLLCATHCLALAQTLISSKWPQDPSLQPPPPVLPLCSHSQSVSKLSEQEGSASLQEPGGLCDPDPAYLSFLTLSPPNPQTRASRLCFQ